MLTNNDDYFGRLAAMLCCKRALKKTTNLETIEHLHLQYEWLRDGELPPEKAKRKAFLDAKSQAE